MKHVRPAILVLAVVATGLAAAWSAGGFHPSAEVSATAPLAAYIPVIATIPGPSPQACPIEGALAGPLLDPCRPHQEPAVRIPSPPGIPGVNEPTPAPLELVALPPAGEVLTIQIEAEQVVPGTRVFQP